MTILALTTGLADEFPFAVRGSLDGFAVGDLWLSSSRLNLELALHAVADDVQMQLTHAGENRLTGVLVRLDAESGILGDEALERSAHLFLVGLEFGSIDIEITGSGKDGGSRRMSKSSSHSVSPVMTSLTPTTAQMSPE